MKINHEHYTYRIIWSPEDQEFVGLCVEFPSLSYLDDDRFRAFEKITSLVQEVIADMEANGEQIPEPISLRRYNTI